MGSKKVPRFISVMGTIGSGKTTVTKLLSDHFHWQFLEENFGENAFLPRFYTDMSRWAFHSQSFFLMEKINQILAVEGMLFEGSVVQDVPIYQDVYGYARAQHALGNMDTAEWALYQKIFHSFEGFLPKPDLIIYLETSVPVVKQRIAGRGRDYEQAIPDSYLELLEAHNAEWLGKQIGTDILTINTDHLNIVTNLTDQKKFIDLVSAKIGYTTPLV